MERTKSDVRPGTRSKLCQRDWWGWWWSWLWGGELQLSEQPPQSQSSWHFSQSSSLNWCWRAEGSTPYTWHTQTHTHTLHKLLLLIWPHLCLQIGAFVCVFRVKRRHVQQLVTKHLASEHNVNIWPAVTETSCQLNSVLLFQHNDETLKSIKLRWGCPAPFLFGVFIQFADYVNKPADLESISSSTLETLIFIYV